VKRNFSGLTWLETKTRAAETWQPAGSECGLATSLTKSKLLLSGRASQVSGLQISMWSTIDGDRRSAGQTGVGGTKWGSGHR
jgi:hypothetical protein